MYPELSWWFLCPWYKNASRIVSLIFLLEFIVCFPQNEPQKAYRKFHLCSTLFPKVIFWEPRLWQESLNNLPPKHLFILQIRGSATVIREESLSVYHSFLLEDVNGLRGLCHLVPVSYVPTDTVLLKKKIASCQRGKKSKNEKHSEHRKGGNCSHAQQKWRGKKGGVLTKFYSPSKMEENRSGRGRGHPPGAGWVCIWASLLVPPKALIPAPPQPSPGLPSPTSGSRMDHWAQSFRPAMATVTHCLPSLASHRSFCKTTTLSHFLKINWAILS